MENDELTEFCREARREILEWMAHQNPPVNKTILSQMLGYRRSSEVSRAIGSTTGLPGETFLKHVAEKIPELAWLKTRYYEIKAGEKPSSASIEKAEIMKSLGQLEVEIKETVERVFKAIREMC